MGGLELVEELGGVVAEGGGGLGVFGGFGHGASAVGIVADSGCSQWSEDPVIGVRLRWMGHMAETPS